MKMEQVKQIKTVAERILFPLYEENPWKVEVVMKFRFGLKRRK